MTLTLESDATRAYAVLAPVYDLLTAEYAYGPWLGAIERVAREHGLRGHRLLDVGCGTGKSFMPLLERGFDVTACDISPEMVELAQHKSGAPCRRVRRRHAASTRLWRVRPHHVH